MKLESPKVSVAKSSEYLFGQLTDLNNFKKLMPENISKFEVVSPDSFDFCLSGMPEIKLKINQTVPHSKIVLGAAGGKLPFTLTINLDAVNNQNTNAQFLFEGEFNAMMAMMVKGPISKFIETLANNMVNL